MAEHSIFEWHQSQKELDERIDHMVIYEFARVVANLWASYYDLSWLFSFTSVFGTFNLNIEIRIERYDNSLELGIDDQIATGDQSFTWCSNCKFKITIEWLIELFGCKRSVPMRVKQHFDVSLRLLNIAWNFNA